MYVRMHVYQRTNISIYMCIQVHTHPLQTKSVTTVTNHMNTTFAEKLVVTKPVCPQGRGTTPCTCTYLSLYSPL